MQPSVFSRFHASISTVTVLLHLLCALADAALLVGGSSLVVPHVPQSKDHFNYPTLNVWASPSADAARRVLAASLQHPYNRCRPQVFELRYEAGTEKHTNEPVQMNIAQANAMLSGPCVALSFVVDGLPCRCVLPFSL
jgi:hypothetical protein